tara:strand:+ start:516 stop:671 length:156 start_codon:yes stop_codon:yes gene_type:complete
MGPEVLTLIGAGGDLAILGALYALYRIDRRLFAVELKLERKANGLAEKAGG